MEFFAAAAVRMSPMLLQRHVGIANLPQWCASIDRVLATNGERGEIYCVWGEFTVHREVVRDGVRFTLPGCPNALQWTVTAESDSACVNIHCTINRQSHEADFIESLEQFVLDWKAGLEGWPARRAAAADRPPAKCAESYGGFG